MKHLSYWLRAGVAVGACAALLAPSAFADNGKKPPGESPGNSANAPGQEKKHEPPAEPGPPETEIQPLPPAPPPAPPSEPAPAAAPDGPAAMPGQPDKPQNADKPPKPEQPEPSRPAVPGPAVSTGKGKPREEKTAHDKVLICHATGSATNPYVLISISVNAWSKGSGHGAHPDDVFIDWSWPGDPRQKDESLCPGHGPASTTPPTSSSTDPTPSASASSSPDTTTPGGVPETADPRSGSTDPATRSTAVPRARRSAGVLATSGRLGRAAVTTALPFTGVSLWASTVLALSLIVAGLAVRRRARRAEEVPTSEPGSI